MNNKARIRRVLVYTVYIILAFSIQSAWPGSVVKANFLLVLAICSAYQFGANDAIVIGLICGFLLDYSSGRLIGVGMLIYLFLALAAAHMFKKNLTRSILPALFITVFCTFLYEVSVRAVMLGYMVLSDVPFSFLSPLVQLRSISRAMILNLIIMIPLFILLRYFGPYKRRFGHSHVEKEGTQARW